MADLAAPPDDQSAGVPGGNTHPVPSGSGGTHAGAYTAPEAATIRAEAIAHAPAVIDLCSLSGQPQMTTLVNGPTTGGFLVWEVREAVGVFIAR